MINTDYEIFLASRSPRRRELLSLILPHFTALSSGFDEDGVDSGALSPRELAVTLSRGKAKYLLSSLPGEKALVIGGDTVVVSPGGTVFGIPKDRKEAFAMLKALSGETHRVITGVSILTKEREFSFSSETKVTFYPLSDQEIEEYLDTGEPFDKAGAYGIQGKGALLVEQIEGDYFTVVGLPVAKLQIALKRFLG